MKKSLLCLFLLGACTPQPAEESSTGSAPLSEILVVVDNFSATAQDSLWRGFHPRGEWWSKSYESQVQRADSMKKLLVKLEAIDDATLSEQEQITRAVLRIALNDYIASVDHKMILIPFNAEGGFYNELGYSLRNLPFNTVQDYRDYLAWLPRYDSSLKVSLAMMKQGVSEGIVGPKVIVQNNLNLLKGWLVDVQQSPFYAPLKKLPEAVNETDRKDILQKAEQIVSQLSTTYQEVNAYFSTEYLAAAKEQPGISFVPGGKEYYENRVRHYTTLPMTPDSVHNLGLAEVARIRAAMEQIIRDLNFKGSFADFLKFLRTDPRFYAKTPQELLNFAAWLSKRAEGQLPKLFNTLYTLPFTVEAVPDAIAPTYTGGRYVDGAWSTKRAGIYWVNTYNLPSRTLYTIPALTVHEAVPGHHLQGAIAAEIKGLPKFRNEYYISAYGEGWGLYSEYLGEEMGMYTTPYEMFGRYTYEMWRACRLVVDTGMHYKGWTREQALQYLAGNTALSIHEVTTEIDRYIGWPGQALSYKVGEIKIKALRRSAEEALGKKFNIGDFHATILLNGSVPLTILEKQVEAYVEGAKEK